MLTPAADVTSRAMRSSTNCDYFVRRTTPRLGDRAFSVAAPEPGIGCHHNWRRRRARSKLSRDASKLFLFNTAFSVNTSWQCNAPSVCL